MHRSICIAFKTPHAGMHVHPLCTSLPIRFANAKGRSTIRRSESKTLPFDYRHFNFIGTLTEKVNYSI